MKQTTKKVAMTAEEKVFNLCKESANNSVNGYTFSIKEVCQMARKKYKMNKQMVGDLLNILTAEHPMRKGSDADTVILTELMPKEENPTTEKKQPKHVLTECEVINLEAQKLARRLFPDFKKFVFLRYDETNATEYKNSDEALKAKADMNNLLYVVKVSEGVQYAGKTRVEAYQNFLNAHAK